MTAISASIFASVAQFVGDNNYNIDNVHIHIRPEKAYIEAVNGRAFCRHALDNIDIGEEKHVLLAPTKETIKACKTKNAETLEILDDLSVRVIDARGNVAYIHPSNAKTCDAGQYPNTDQFIEKVNNPEGFAGVDHISLSCGVFDLLKAAFGKDAVFTFAFTGKAGPIKVSVSDTDFVVIVMPMVA